MKIDLIPDYAGEALLKLEEVLNWVVKSKKELAEKDKKILELEEKLKKYQNGS